MNQLDEQTKNASIGNLYTKIKIYWSLSYVCAKDRKGNYSDLFFSGISHALRIFIFAAVYRVAFGSSSDPGFISAIWAVSLAQTMFSFDRPPLTVTMGEEIKDGTISIFLLKPLSYINYSYFSYMGKSIPSICTSFIFCMTSAFLLTSKMPGNAIEMLLTLMTAVSGLFVVNIIATTLGLFGFWTQDTSAFNWIDHKMSLLFGGLIIPLFLLPDGVQNVVRFTPWTAALAQPGKLLSNFSYDGFAIVLFSHFFWLVVIYALAVFMMKKGTNKLVVSGG